MDARAPSKNGALVSSGIGAGLAIVCDIGVYSLTTTLTAGAESDNDWPRLAAALDRSYGWNDTAKQE